ncbi:HAMP domain-containing protein [Anaerobacterium chartisolvens]|uniref:histidine kinase n=1 Tax=Anaerobacterium chartisolvens TaxID=1297424 RepID=A0A369AUR9_9FIRM|nr:HAMP domain-containing sensor histidine kinase [Anaerobacterium chartisolvens]RCX12951.1 HAMP domain-containing protein [Anaerobacterium chartisolvens]
MTIKKRLFYSNLVMVVAPLIAFIAASLIFGGILRATLFSDFSGISLVDESLLEIQTIIDDSDMNLLVGNQAAQNDLMDKIADKGFRLWVEQEGEVLFTNMNHREQSYISQYIVSERLQASNQTFWDRTFDFNLLWHRVETNAAPIVFIAVGSNKTMPFEAIGVTSASTIIVFLMLIIAVVVFIVVVISLFLANKIVKKIILPLDNLCDGAERIREGNLDEDIPYGGIEELEKVCGSFNEMQRQLKANIKKNEVYEQNRKEMLVGISHDLRTPLTSIKSYVKGLQDEVAKTPEKQKEYLDVIYRKSCDMEGLLNRLFLFSKLETGNMPFNFDSIFIQKYIATLLDSLEYDLKKNNAILTLENTCSHQKVLLDTEQMTRTITNIIDNSIKYNPSKQVHITVTLTPQDDKINIRIQDDGLGVSTKQLSRLFDSFYRGDESRKNSNDGSGLGLAIAKNIVIAHGGSIYAESYNGLAIIIELPVEKEDSQ